jgi:hypothetical protein
MKLFFPGILLFLIIGLSNISSQTRHELDSLYNLFLNIRGFENSVSPEGPSATEKNLKCGLHIINSLQFNLSSFSQDKQELLKVLLQRPSAANSLITPGGQFKIHYNQSGPNAPTYDVNQLALALDSVYSFEIEFLGYDFPPGDSLYNPDLSPNEYGGDNRYDIYIMNLSGLYGYTQFETEVQPGSSRFTSFMVIDNDFAGYYTSGINGARVTVAHEFHHAIQGGNYVFRTDDTFFYEITSTAMEEFVFDSINDYYAYMPDYFQRPSRAFPNNNGYNLAIWHIYLKEIFGFDIIKRQWELMRNNRAIRAISNSIEERGSVFEFELARFGIWSYFTNYRAISGLYFREAAFYPALIPTASTVYSPPSQLYEFSGFPAANYFMRMVNTSNNDTIVSIFGNGDIQNAIGNTIPAQMADYTLYSDTTSGDYKIGDFYSADFNNRGNNFWSQAEIVNNIPLTGDSLQIISQQLQDILAFPSPYRYNNPQRSGESIRFSVDIDLNKEVDVNIYTTSMDLVSSFNQTTKPYILRDPDANIGRQISIIEWARPENEKSENLASGVYIIIIKNGNDYLKGKFVIFND